MILLKSKEVAEKNKTKPKHTSQLKNKCNNTSPDHYDVQFKTVTIKK